MLNLRAYVNHLRNKVEVLVIQQKETV